MRGIIAALFILKAALAGAQPPEAPNTVPPAAIGAGTPLWVDSERDPEFALINVRVDIGNLRQTGNAYEAALAWTLTLGLLRDTQSAHPDIRIPDQSLLIEVMRIECGKNGLLSYRVGSSIVDPDRTVLMQENFSPDKTRAKAVEQQNALARALPLPSGYHPDPPSLVCWAVARKCEGVPFSWPPPPNHTPLNNTPRARQMRSAYNSRFVPSCRL